MHGHRHQHRGFGRRRPFPNREEWLRRLEEHQRDLEQELADVADVIRHLKSDAPEGATTGRRECALTTARRTTRRSSGIPTATGSRRFAIIRSS